MLTLVQVPAVPYYSNLTYERTTDDSKGDKSEGFFSHIFSLLILAVLSHFLGDCTIAPIRGAESEQRRLLDGVFDSS